MLGGDQLMVGLNGLSTEVSGPIEDGGHNGGSGASLVKVGPGTLKLSNAGNTYTGGTILEAGRLDLDRFLDRERRDAGESDVPGARRTERGRCLVITSAPLSTTSLGTTSSTSLG